jgi:sulfatase modifying factor 1
MVGTRGKGEVSTGTNHLGFRCVMTLDQWNAKSKDRQTNAARPNDTSQEIASVSHPVPHTP